MKSLQDKYCYSLNQEEFYGDFDTKEAAIEQGKEEALEEGQHEFFIGVCEEYTPSVSAWQVIESIQEDAYDKHGEYSQAYLDDVSNEHKEELQDKLNEVLSKWIEEHNYIPDFWGVKDVEKRTI